MLAFCWSERRVRSVRTSHGPAVASGLRVVPRRWLLAILATTLLSHKSCCAGMFDAPMPSRPCSTLLLSRWSPWHIHASTSSSQLSAGRGRTYAGMSK